MFGDFGLMTIWGGTLSVDTFFLLSGFLMSYLTLKDLGNRPLSGIKIPFQYLHRYIRYVLMYINISQKLKR